MGVFLVTSNPHKYEEMRKMMEKEGIELKWSKMEIVERKYETEKEVSMGKAYAAVKELNAPVLVEDTGIYIEEFNNFPGPNAHVVFSGIGLNGIMKLMEGIENRSAFFRTSVAFCKPGEAPITFVGTCRGKIADKISEVIDFAYDSLFIPDGDTRTFSEMTKEEKNKFSHRMKAMEAFMKWYKETELKKKDLNDNPSLE